MTIADTVTTERLVLEPLAVEHAGEMAVVLADPGLHEFIGGAPLDVAELGARYERLVAGSPEPGVRWLNWVVRLRAKGCLVGTVQATVTDVAEISWVVGTPWQGRGIASEAARALVAWLGGRTVIAHIHPDNLASAAVARAAGLSPTDRFHDGEVMWRREAGGGGGRRG